ncbi:hypothetical protein [Peterkaempfera sp. SMS 1(5)a]|uniref:hypothetical protein n=1 Tax=Peterkaempfera podocarpi TaxID=3232308 RepID=UPI00366C569E
MSLARAEIERCDWDSIECGCGRSARHLAELLESLIEGSAGAGAIRALDDHVFIQSNLMAPAPAVCSVAMAMLADGVSVNRIDDVLWLILWLAAGEEDGDSIEASRYWQCVERIRDGLWLIYRELFDARSAAAIGYANDILEIIEWDPMRLQSYRRICGLE